MILRLAFLLVVLLATPVWGQVPSGTVRIQGSPKGSTAAGNVTSTPVDANTQALDVRCFGCGSVSFPVPQHVIVDSGSVGVTQGTSPWVVSGTVTANQGTSPWVVSGSVIATQSGAWTVQPGNTPNTTPWLVDQATQALASANRQAVTTSAAALPSNVGKRVCIRVLSTSTQPVYFGPSGVTTSTGQELLPGDAWCAPIANTNQVYVIASSTGSTVSYDVLQ